MESRKIMTFNLNDYIDVKERIKLFIAKYPEGSLRFEFKGALPHNPEYIWGVAYAYRTPDDPAPAIGTAQELAQGRTSFTRGSEIQNLETSAWGRSISALGLGIDNGIASRQEVLAAQSRQEQPQIRNAPSASTSSDAVNLPRPFHPIRPATQKQMDTILRMLPADHEWVLEFAKSLQGLDASHALPIDLASKLIDLLKQDVFKTELILRAERWRDGKEQSEVDPWKIAAQLSKEGK